MQKLAVTYQVTDDWKNKTLLEYGIYEKGDERYVTETEIVNVNDGIVIDDKWKEIFENVFAEAYSKTGMKACNFNFYKQI